MSVAPPAPAPLPAPPLPEGPHATPPLPDGQDAAPCHRGEDLSGRSFPGISWAGVDLRDADLRGVDLRGASLRGALLQGASLLGTRLEGVDLRGANLDGATLDGATLDGASLDGARLRDTTWHRVTARSGSWEGVDLRGASVIDGAWATLALSRARLDGARFWSTTLDSLDLRAASGTALSFERCTLQGIRLEGSTLPELRFIGCTLLDLDLRLAELPRARLVANRWTAPRLDGVRCGDALVDGTRGLDAESIGHLRRGGAVVPRGIVRALVDGAAAVPWGTLGPALVGAFVVLSSIYAVGTQIWESREAQVAAPAGPPGAEDRTPDPADQERLLVLEGRLTAPAGERVAVLIDLAAVLERLGKVQDAEDRLMEAVELQAQVVAQAQLAASTGQGPPPPDPRPEDDPDLALWRFYVRRGLLHDAIALAQERQRDARNAWEEVHARLLVARTHLAGKDAAACRAELLTVTGRLPALTVGRVEFHLDVVRIYQELGDLPRALTTLLELPPEMGDEDRAEAELLRADLLASTGDPVGAIALLDTIQERWPDFTAVAARAHAARTRVLDQPGATPTVIGGLQTMAGAVDPDRACQGVLLLARFYQRAGDPGRAILGLEMALERPGPALPCRLDLARSLSNLRVSRGEWAEALAALEIPAASDPDRVLLLLRAERLAEVARYDEAEALLTDTLALSDLGTAARARASLTLGRLFVRRHRQDDARRAFEQVLVASPGGVESSAAQIEIGRIHIEEGRFADAEARLDDAARSLPGGHRLQGEVAIERAALWARTGRADPQRLEGLLADARGAGLPEVAPTAYGELLLQLGRALLSERRYDDARATAERVRGSAAARSDPRIEQRAVEVEVEALVALGRRQEAERLLDLMPLGDLADANEQQACGARVARARGQAGSGDVPGAAATWAAAFVSCQSPKFAAFELPLASDALVEHGGATEARALLRSVRDGATDPVVRQAACLELLRLGEWADLECATGGPDLGLSDLARVEHGALLLASGRLAEAEPLWRSVLEHEGAEPCERARAQHGLARLDLARGLGESAVRRLEQARSLCDAELVVADGRTILDAMRRGGVEQERPRVSHDPRGPGGDSREPGDGRGPGPGPERDGRGPGDGPPAPGADPRGPGPGPGRNPRQP